MARSAFSATLGASGWNFRAQRPRTVPISTPKAPALVPTSQVKPNNATALTPGAAAQERNLLGIKDAGFQRLVTDRTTAAGDVRQALKGYGGWTVKDDGAVEFDANSKLGEKDRASVWEARAQSNARGMLDSSAGNQAVGAALSRMSLEAQQIVTQYAGRLETLNNNFQQSDQDLATKLMDLYGNEGAWMLDNPPPILTTNPYTGREYEHGGVPADQARPDQPGSFLNQKGPWASKPNLDPKVWKVIKGADGKWYARRKGQGTIIHGS